MWNEADLRSGQINLQSYFHLKCINEGNIICSAKAEYKFIVKLNKCQDYSVICSFNFIFMDFQIAFFCSRYH